MFDSPVIEVAVGITFLFMVFSFCATAIVEALAEWRQWRGRLLHAKLETILGPDFVTHFYCERRVADLASGASDAPPDSSVKPEDLLRARVGAYAQAVFRPVNSALTIGRFSTTSLEHAVALAARMNAKRLPAYIPESVFADIMLDWLQGVSLPQALHPDSANAAVLPYDQAELWARMNRRADGDQALLRDELVRWYRQTTEHISGEFRRKIRIALYAVGLVIVLALNLDAIRMATTLYADPVLRTQFAAAGEAVVVACPNGAKDCPQLQAQAKQAVEDAVAHASAGLIGWKPATGDGWLGWADGLMAQVAAITLAGWLITILAIGMGADFWFGLLRWIVALRNGDKNKSVDETLSSEQAAQPDTPAPRSAPARDPLDIANADLAPLKGFQPLRFAESNVHAFWLGHFASLAYSQEHELNGSALLERHGLGVQAFDEGGTQAFLFSGPNIAILAFRGTEQLPEDWITDARLAQLANPWAIGDDALKVHRGFHDALDQVWTPLLAALAQVRTPLWITGHSLGGALALLAAYRLAASRKQGLPTIGGVYTFGQPRTGNTVFADRCPPELAQRIFRYVNSSDIVPLVPPSRIESYAHLGHFRYFDASGRLHHERTLWERIAEKLTPTLAAIGDPSADWKAIAMRHARERIENHSMSRYIECLERIDAVRALRTAK